MNIPESIKQILVKKYNRFNSDYINRKYDFFSFYFIFNTICALKGTKLDQKEINYRNKLFSLYNGKVYNHYIKKIKQENYPNKLDDWREAIGNKAEPFRSEVFNKIMELMDKDLNNVVKPFMEKLKEEEKKEFVSSEDSELFIVGVCKDYGYASDLY